LVAQVGCASQRSILPACTAPRAVLRKIELNGFEKLISFPGGITWLSPLASYGKLHRSLHCCYSSISVTSRERQQLLPDASFLFSSCYSSISVTSRESQFEQKRYMHFPIMAQSS